MQFINENTQAQILYNLLPIIEAISSSEWACYMKSKFKVPTLISEMPFSEIEGKKECDKLNTIFRQLKEESDLVFFELVRSTHFPGKFKIATNANILEFSVEKNTRGNNIDELRDGNEDEMIDICQSLEKNGFGAWSHAYPLGKKGSTNEVCSHYLVNDQFIPFKVKDEQTQATSLCFVPTDLVENLVNQQRLGREFNNLSL